MINNKTSARKKTCFNNTISLSRHEQVCLMRLRFERYVSRDTTIPEIGGMINNKTSARKKTCFNNTISLSRHEQVCLMRLRFERYFSRNVASFNILVHDVINLLYYEH